MRIEKIFLEDYLNDTRTDEIGNTKDLSPKESNEVIKQQTV